MRKYKNIQPTNRPPKYHLDSLNPNDFKGPIHSAPLLSTPIAQNSPTANPVLEQVQKSTSSTKSKAHPAINTIPTIIIIWSSTKDYLSD